jgi:hypothetical protein
MADGLADKGSSRSTTKGSCLAFSGTRGEQEKKEQSNDIEMFHDVFS